MKQMQTHPGMRLATLLWLILGLSAAAPGPALAGEAASDWHATDFGRSRLVASHTSIAPAGGAPVFFAWEIDLQPGWKTYWRSPGEAGKPTTLILDPLSTASAADFEFPLPMKFTILGMETWGYKGRVLIPIRARYQAGEPLRLNLMVDYMVCKDVCIPLVDSYDLRLPAAKFVHARSGFAADIYAAFARVPPKARAAAAVAISAVRLWSPKPGAECVTIVLTHGRGGAIPDIIAEVPFPFLLHSMKRETGLNDEDLGDEGLSDEDLGAQWVAYTFDVDDGDERASLTGETLTLTTFTADGIAFEAAFTLFRPNS